MLGNIRFPGSSAAPGGSYERVLVDKGMLTCVRFAAVVDPRGFEATLRLSVFSSCSLVTHAEAEGPSGLVAALEGMYQPFSSSRSGAVIA